MPQPSSNQPEIDLFEGSDHVLYGIEQQLAFWTEVDGHPVEKSEMIPALTNAAATLRTALNRAKTTTKP